MRISSSDLHPYLLARMHQRGVTMEQLEETLNHGWEASDVKPGAAGKAMVFDYAAEWEGRFYQEKEVTVYYKVTDAGIVLLTTKARYGDRFPRG